MRKRLPQAPDAAGTEPPCIDRRNATRRVGGWLIFGAATGGLATINACGRTPLGEPVGDFIIGDDDDDDDGGTTITTVPTVSGTPTPGVCECPGVESGSPTGLTTSDLSVGEYAFHAGLQIFLCRDAGGYYAMSSICTHSSCNMGTQGGNMDFNNLAGGFSCSCHGSSFNSNGERTGGPAPVGSVMLHFRMSFDAGNQIYIDKVAPFEDKDCRCTPP